MRAARVAVYARQAVTHPQRHIQRFLQLTLQQTGHCQTMAKALLSALAMQALLLICTLP